MRCSSHRSHLCQTLVTKQPINRHRSHCHIGIDQNIVRPARNAFSPIMARVITNIRAPLAYTIALSNKVFTSSGWLMVTCTGCTRRQSHHDLKLTRRHSFGRIPKCAILALKHPGNVFHHVRKTFSFNHKSSHQVIVTRSPNH